MYLRMKPVCKCGYIFDNIKMGQTFYADSTKYTIPGCNISPSHCPVCGEKIEGFLSQHAVDGIFEYDEEKYDMGD